MSEGPSLSRWLLILAFGGTKAGLLVHGWPPSVWPGPPHSRVAGRQRERERKEDAVFLL